MNLVLSLFDKINTGSLTFQLPDGSTRHFGDKNSPHQAQAQMTLSIP
jgi:hypothetical protein